MIAASVVLCPPAPDEDGLPAAATVAALLDAAGVPCLTPAIPADDGPTEAARARDAHWVGRTAMAVAGASLPGPTLLVVHGGAGRLAPALGFAQRAARRPVAGYLLVDAVLPVQGHGGDWPDGPVRYLLTTAADDDARAASLQARLRGWDVVTVDADPTPAALAAAILVAIDPAAAP